MSDEIVKNPENDLTEFERDELKKWRRTEQAPLALSTALKMYQMFLLGHSCEEITRANENKFAIGMVIDARIRHGWDKRRDAYIDTLYSEAGSIVKQRQIESAIFLGDLLAVAHIEYGEKLQKFMQTRDPKDLPDNLKVTSITTYKMIVDALIKVTGQDKKDGSSSVPGVQVIGNNVTLQEAPKAVSGQDAFNILQALDAMDNKSKK